MKILPIICISFLMGHSCADALVRLSITQHNNNRYSSEPQLLLEESQTGLIELETIRLQTSLERENAARFILSYKDPEGNFVPFYTSDVLLLHDGDEIGFESADGSFCLRVRITII